MNVAFFDTAGNLINVSPRNESVSLYEDRQVAYNADAIVVGTKVINLHSGTDVARIPIPDFAPGEDVTGNLAYVMKMRCGTAESVIIEPFITKTIDLMLASEVGWRAGDYFQVIRNFYRCARFEEGDEFEALFRRNHASILNDLGIARYEKEHASTKAYWKRKAEKRK